MTLSLNKRSLSSAIVSYPPLFPILTKSFNLAGICRGGTKATNASNGFHKGHIIGAWIVSTKLEKVNWRILTNVLVGDIKSSKEHILPQ